MCKYVREAHVSAKAGERVQVWFFWFDPGQKTAVFNLLQDFIGECHPFLARNDTVAVRIGGPEKCFHFVHGHLYVSFLQAEDEFFRVDVAAAVAVLVDLIENGEQFLFR